MAIDTTSIGTAPHAHVPTTAPSAEPVDAIGDDAPTSPLPRFGPGLVRYQPAIDGLRAVAVLAVLAYHWPAAWMPGGFLGVEVFFVISGYLITSLLLGERVRTGRTDFKAFWLRRARRLLPALYALLVVVSAVWLIWHPSEVAGLRGAVVAAALYVSNWYLIAVKQSYFQAVGRPSPLLHLWSLAVEEQFYLIWPLALVGMLRLFRRRLRLVLIATVALAAGSAALGMVLYHPGIDPYRVWYGTDTRASGILLGAALAIAVPPWQMRARVQRSARVLFNVIAVVTLAGVGWMFVHVNELDPFVYRGGFVLLDLLTVGLILALVHPASTLVARGLGSRPLVWIGRRSYGIYLWHWPIFVLTRPGLDVTWPGWALLAVRLGGTLVAAELSYRFVELPVRNGTVLRWLRAHRPPAPATAEAAEPTADPVTESPADGVDATVGGAVGAIGADLTEPADEPDDGAEVVTEAGTGPTGRELVAAGAAPATSGRTRRPPGRVLVASVAAVAVVAVIGTGLVRAKPSDSIPGLDLRGVVHDKLGNIIADGSDPGVNPRAVKAAVSSTTTAAPPSTVAAPVTTVAPPPPTLPPIVPIPGGQLVAVGDSVLLGARGWVGQQFPGVLINAEVGRQFDTLPSLLAALGAAGDLRPEVIIDLGTNGPPTPADLAQVLTALAGAQKVVLVTTREPRSWQDESNQRLTAAVAGHPNVVIADWYAASANHPEYFVSDGVHLTEAGGQAYAETLAAALR
jgi:peptidoglycan/LPS O-acetylase OafA/YrhL